MIAQFKRSRATPAELHRRLVAVRAAKLAFHTMPARGIAEMLGLTPGQVLYYLSGRVKQFPDALPWSQDFYAAAGLIAHGDFAGAAAKFKRLSETLAT